MAAALLLLTIASGALVILGIVGLAVRLSGIRRSPRARMAATKGRRSAAVRHPFGRTSKPLGIFGAVLALCLLALVGVEALSVVRNVNRVQRGSQHLADASRALGPNPDDWTTVNISTAQTLQQDAGREIDASNQALQASWLLRLFDQLPVASTQVTGLWHLADMSEGAARAMGSVVHVAAMVQEARTSQEQPGPRLLTLIAATGPDWQNAAQSLEGPLRNVRADQDLPLLQPLRATGQHALAQLEPILAQARMGAAAARFGPRALGAGAAQTYLVLLPNPSELRPAGGFSGSVATVVMAGGAPASIDVRSQDDFNPLMKQRQPVPVPLARYLKFYKNGLELGDAGWDPDFPTSARLSEQMYTEATKKQVDGTLSVDPYSLAALLAVVGSVDVPGYGTFDSGNFFAKLNAIVNASSGPGSGKAALPPVSRAVLAKVLQAPASRWPAMLAVFKVEAERRHIQAYFHETTIGQAAAALHYDGGLAPANHDYLMVTDANVGATKGDNFVRKAMEVKTEIQAGRAVALHQVELTYDMPLPANAEDRALNPGDGSYRDYIGFILPKEAAVASLKVVSDGTVMAGGIDAISFAHERQIVSTFVRVPRGHVATVTLIYEVPLDSARHYDLYLQKQAGIPSIQADLQFSYPGGQTRRSISITGDQEVRLAW